MIEKRNFDELQTSFYNQPLMPYLGAKLAFIKDGKANIELDFDKDLDLNIPIPKSLKLTMRSPYRKY